MNSKANILILPPSGVSAKNVMELATFLDREYYQRNIVFMGKIPEDLTSYLLKEKVSIFEATSPKELASIIRKEAIDIFHIARDGVDYREFIEESHHAGVKVIVETNVFGYPDESITGKLVDLVTLPSILTMWMYASRAHFSISAVLQKAKVVYHSISLEKFENLKPSSEEVKELKDSLGIPESSWVLLRVARPDVRKWGLLVISTLKKLVRHNNDVRLLCVGGLTPDARHLIKTMGLERFVIDAGRVRDDLLVKMYHLADIFVHSSFAGETFGVAIAEAMMAGKPVITNATPWVSNSQLELVDPGLTGLVATGPQDFCNKVNLLLNSEALRRSMGKNAYEKARRLFEARSVGQSMGKIYSDLLLGKGEKSNSRVSHYSDVKVLPTNEEIINFNLEYGRRLRALGFPNSGASNSFLKASMYASDNVPRLRFLNAILGSYFPRPLDFISNFS
ncbi:MAG: glycosyltransferase family 4 protein [Nitrososphaerales archaeon]